MPVPRNDRTKQEATGQESVTCSVQAVSLRRRGTDGLEGQGVLKARGQLPGTPKREPPLLLCLPHLLYARE